MDITEPDIDRLDARIAQRVSLRNGVAYLATGDARTAASVTRIGIGYQATLNALRPADYGIRTDGSMQAVRFFSGIEDAFDWLDRAFDWMAVEPAGNGLEGALDPVEHPRRYTDGPVECIMLAERYGFNIGNAIKYVYRHKSERHPRQDLDKALWYLNRARSHGDRPLPLTGPRTVGEASTGTLLRLLSDADWAGAARFWTGLADALSTDGATVMPLIRTVRSMAGKEARR